MKSLPLAFFGLLFGGSVSANVLALGGWKDLGSAGFLVVSAGAVAGILFLFGLRGSIRRMVDRLVPDALFREYQKHDTLTYAVFLLALSCGLGIQVSVPTSWPISVASLKISG